MESHREPLRGTFDQRLIEENPLFSRYARESISFTAGSIAGRITRIHRHRPAGVVELEWEGTGRVWQVKRATNVLGPWRSSSPVIPDLLRNDSNAFPEQSFYRLRQW